MREAGADRRRLFRLWCFVVYSRTMRIRLTAGLAAAAFSALLAPAIPAQDVKPGIEVLISDSLHLLRGKRVGLITNHTGVDRRGRRNVDLLFNAPGVKL